MGSQRAGHELVTKQQQCNITFLVGSVLSVVQKDEMKLSNFSYSNNSNTTFQIISIVHIIPLKQLYIKEFFYSQERKCAPCKKVVV